MSTAIRFIQHAMTIPLVLAAASPALAQQADKVISGYAYAVDAVTLKIGDDEIRLATLAGPALDQQAESRDGRSYPAGLFARDALAGLITGQNTACRVTAIDRNVKDRHGRWFAICASSAAADLGAEMIRRGWSLLDRRKGIPVYTTYQSAENAAKTMPGVCGRGHYRRLSKPHDRCPAATAAFSRERNLIC